MIQQGYYVYRNRLAGPDVDVVYTTGQKGGGGHCYWRRMQGQMCTGTRPGTKWLNGWSTLLWSCVPGRDAVKNYTYYPACPPGIPDWK